MKPRIILRNNLAKKARRRLQFQVPRSLLFEKASRIAFRLGRTRRRPSRPDEILVVFDGDRAIGRVKKIFWGRREFADVISFAYDDPPLIEILINVEQAKRQAPWPLQKEILFLYIHGLLHILGHRDNSQKKRAAMLKLGEIILNQTLGCR